MGQMKEISVRLPTQLLDKIKQKAQSRGLDRSKVIRQDLTNKYYED